MTITVSSSLSLSLCHRRAGLDVSLQSCGGDRGQAAPVRDVRGRGRAPMSLHQRDARLQRQVVQERQGVLQVGSPAKMAKWAEFMKISASLAASLHLIHCSYLPGKADPITIHNVEGITLDVSVMSDNCQHQSWPALMLISSLSSLHIIVSRRSHL